MPRLVKALAVSAVIALAGVVIAAPVAWSDRKDAGTSTEAPAAVGTIDAGGAALGAIQTYGAPANWTGAPAPQAPAVAPAEEPALAFDIAADNLSFTVIAPPGGLPEPASLGLVVLTIICCAILSVRRRRH